MFSRLSVCCALACLLVLGLAAPSFARGGRDIWVHDSGEFRNERGINWVEHINGTTFHFRERCRTDEFVDLYDASRDCTVRLTRYTCLVKFGSDGFAKYYEGHWNR